MVTDARSQQADALLKNLQQQRGGQLKIFLGAAPGVGKTCAMLNAARERQQQGCQVLVGLVECHGRADTQALLQGFVQLPRREIQYQGQPLSDFDLDAALAAHPELLLVDELAHSNIPGSRHKRRYQDIAEVLAAGIDVYTTVNVQHIASLNDLVLQISGIRVQETVPDQFIDSARQLVFVDLAPNHLLERLQQGKVYLADYAATAVQQFFQLETLTALREMAMKRVMTHLDSQLSAEQAAKARSNDYLIQDKLLVLISNRRDHEYLIRQGRRIAEKRQMPWLVVWVDTGQQQYQPMQQRLQSALALARELGAATDILRGPSTLTMVLPYISEHRINTVLVGAGVRRFWQPWRKPLYQQLINSSLPLEVSVCRSEELQPQRVSSAQSGTFGQKAGYAAGILLTGVASGLALLLDQWLQSGNLVLIYVMAVVLAGLKFGARPAIFTALLSFLSFDFFLTEPFYSFDVNKHHDVATLIFMLVIGMVCGPAASRIRQQLLLLKAANRYSELQRDFAQQLTVLHQTEDLWLLLAKQLQQALRCPVHLVLWQAQQQQLLPTLPQPLLALDQAMLDWCRRHQQRAGRFSDTLNASSWTALPVLSPAPAATQPLAVLMLQLPASQLVLRSDDLDLIQSLVQQAASVWQRIDLSTALESSKIKAEMEQLRSALLSSVSHDLRSPLAAMMGSAESLQVLDQQLLPADRTELLNTIVSESQRLDRYIQNLLDMTRLGHGTLKLQRDWVSIDDIVGSAKQRLKRFFPHQALIYQPDVKMPPLYVHAALLEQALFNILENAAKYSPEGEAVVLRVRHQSGGSGQSSCRIEIADKGPGIPAQLREKVFDMFYVVADGDSKRHNTGMGLAICRGMIGAHGGTVRAMAAVDGTGSLFVIELPLTEPQP